jgi:N-acetyl-gamma-glutamylphosphate reductase
MPTDAPQPLNVREIYSLLARRRDAAFVCFTLLRLLSDPTCIIRSVERRPASVQIGYAWRLDGPDDEVVSATQDLPFMDLPDDDAATIVLTVLVQGQREEVTRMSAPTRLYDIPFFREWRARWAERPDGDEVCYGR